MTELTDIKARADVLGINYHPNIGLEKLKARVVNEEQKRNTPQNVHPVVTPVVPQKTKKTKAQIFAERKGKASRLIRINVTCMNPDKKNWKGEIFSAGSAKLGTFKKYVPFNTPDGWHVPYIIYEMIKARLYSHFVEKVGPRGIKTKEAVMVPEFSIDVLDPLTQEQLEELARRQAESRAID